MPNVTLAWAEYTNFFNITVNLKDIYKTSEVSSVSLKYFSHPSCEFWGVENPTLNKCIIIRLPEVYFFLLEFLAWTHYSQYLYYTVA